MTYEELFISESLPNSLNKSEIYHYFEEYKNGDMKARKIIIEHNIRLVIREVNKKFSDTMHDKQELVSIGLIGLIKSVDTFDTLKNFEFATYAVKCIDNEILSFIRRERKHLLVDSFERKLENSENDLELKDTLKDESGDLVLDYENKELVIQLMKLMNHLSEREAQIIKLYFGFYNGRTYNQREISEMLNCSGSNVSKLLNRSLNKMKNILLKQEFVETNAKIKNY